MNDPSDYSITVKGSYEDGSHTFQARVKELPHVLGLGDTYSEAYEMALEAIEGLQEMAADDGASFPEPAQENSIGWSGRVTLRLPRSLHRQATEVAEEEDVSLNQFLVTVITEAVARRSAVTSQTDSQRNTTVTNIYPEIVSSYRGAQKRLVVTELSSVFVLPAETTKEVLYPTSSSKFFIVNGLTGNG